MSYGRFGEVDFTELKSTAEGGKVPESACHTVLSDSVWPLKNTYEHVCTLVANVNVFRSFLAHVAPHGFWSYPFTSTNSAQGAIPAPTAPAYTDFNMFVKFVLHDPET